MITATQYEALQKINQLFSQLEKYAEVSGVKPDEMAELLTFSYIDNLPAEAKQVNSFSEDRREIFTSYQNNKVRKTAL